MVSLGIETLTAAGGWSDGFITIITNTIQYNTIVYTIYMKSFYVYYFIDRPRRRPSPTPPTPDIFGANRDANPAENMRHTDNNPVHYALIKNTLTIYGLVYPQRLSKKKSTGGIGFFQKYSVQEIENESIPLFWGSNATKKSNGCFRGIKFRQNEIKPLYYIV